MPQITMYAHPNEVHGMMTKQQLVRRLETALGKANKVKKKGRTYFNWPNQEPESIGKLLLDAVYDLPTDYLGRPYHRWRYNSFLGVTAFIDPDDNTFTVW